MKIRMIVLDLDRTLLRTDKSISEYTARVLNDCQRNGSKIVFATARSENSCKRVAEMIQPDAIVSNGGALVRVGEEVVYRAAMREEVANGLLRACLGRPGVGCITVESEKGYFSDRLVDANDRGWFEFVPSGLIDFTHGLDCDAYKITVEIPDEATARAIVEKFPSVNVIPFSGEPWFRFADKAADKWLGIKALAERFGIDLADAAAFGDDFSDIEMLRGCGTGVAVANAIDEAKAAADFVCGSNDDDGVAKWLEENFRTCF